MVLRIVARMMLWPVKVVLCLAATVLLAMFLFAVALTWQTGENPAHLTWEWIRTAPGTMVRAREWGRALYLAIQNEPTARRPSDIPLQHEPEAGANGTEPAARDPVASVRSGVAISPSEVTISVGDAWAAAQERHVLDAINSIREEHGLKALKWDASLEQIARARAREIFETQYAASNHVLKRSGAAKDAAAAAGLPKDGIAETLALYRSERPTEPTVDAADGWFNSSSHRAILLDPALELVGIGIAHTDRPVQVTLDGDPRELNVTVSAVYRRVDPVLPCVPGANGCPDDPAPSQAGHGGAAH